MRSDPAIWGLLGIVLGVDMIVLFLATAIGISGLVLLTGGLASVVLGPLWWVSVARLLWAPGTAGVTPRPAASTPPVGDGTHG